MLSARQQAVRLNRRFTVPNELFSLGLNSAGISIYAYLLYCEDRKTHQCWPSYQTIAKEVGLSPKTVRKYIIELVDKGLITTENTTITTRDGRKRNGSLCYTIRPIQEAVEQHHQRQLQQVEIDTARWRAEQAQTAKQEKGLALFCASPPTSARSAGSSGL